MPAPRTRLRSTASSPDNTARKLRVSIQTLGCRLNQYEADGIMNQFVASGRYEALGDVQSEPSDAEAEVAIAPDIAIINTCTVTDQADSRNRSAIQAALKKNPDCRVIVTGCFAQTDPEVLAALPGVRMVVGNDRKPALFQLVDEMIAGEAVAGALSPAVPTFPARFHPEPARFKDHAINRAYGERPILENPFAYGDVVPFGHTRAYMKIQDGCDRRCTYCKIPMARGRGVSRPLDDILTHVRRLDEQGVPEIVITGVNLGWYRDASSGAGTDPTAKRAIRFASLIERILDTLSRARLRLSSIEPCDIDGVLGELSLHPRFCDFLHVPLQSGSARILKAMRRTYSPFSFLKRMEKVHSINPQIFAGTDVIVGFPGESPEDFADTVKVCRDTQMANIHGFRYSPRRGTPASDYPDRVPHDVVRERMGLLAEAKTAGFAKYAARFVGSEREVVVEKLDDFSGEGLSDNYLRIGFDRIASSNQMAAQTVQKGDLARLRISGMATQGPVILRGEVVSVAPPYSASVASA